MARAQNECISRVRTLFWAAQSTCLHHIEVTWTKVGTPANRKMHTRLLNDSFESAVSLTCPENVGGNLSKQKNRSLHTTHRERQQTWVNNRPTAADDSFCDPCSFKGAWMEFRWTSALAVHAGEVSPGIAVGLLLNACHNRDIVQVKKAIHFLLPSIKTNEDYIHMACWPPSNYLFIYLFLLKLSHKSPLAFWAPLRLWKHFNPCKLNAQEFHLHLNVRTLTD